jgi:PAS domain S-box-containing protein
MEEKKYNNLNQVEENIYKEIIENSSTAIALLDADGRISLINDAFCTISGYSREELIGENWTDKIPEDEKDRLLILTRKRVKDVPSKYEFKFNKKNGELRYGLITAAVIKSTNKTVITFTDITERKMQEEALREREVHYRSLIEYANDIIYSLTVEGILIYASPNWTERLGHKMNEIIGHSFTEFVHPDDIFRLAKLIVENFSHGEKLNDIVYRVKDINNEWHWYSSSSSPIFDSAGHVVSLIGIAHDITEQKIAEQNIIDSQAKLNMALKIAQLGTWERNLETNSFIFNDSFYDIFKTSAEEVGGYTMTSHEYIERFVHPDDRDMIRHKIKDTDIVLSNNTVFNLEHRIIFPNGEVGHIAVYFTSLLNEKGETIKTFGINQNITERKKAEQAIIDSENQLREMNAAKDKFFSIIAHDLRSPFSTVVGISELMADSNYKLTLEEMRENSQLLYKAACSTFSLLENLLEWSKLQRGLTVIHRETIELRKFIDNINESAIESAKKKSIKLTIEIEKDLKVNADPNMLHSILRNLITNAIKFTNTGGAVIVLAKQIENKTRLFQVKDTGIGMPPKIINNLFRIDANNSRPGTNDEPSSGLGLILCKEFIEKHGGKIWAESTVGSGSTFSFTIR